MGKDDEPEKENMGTCGGLVALVAYGAQDKWMGKDDKMFDARNLFLKNRHHVVYKRIECSEKWWNESRTKVRLCINRTCDLINMLDLRVSNPDALNLNQIIKSIETEFGGQRMDKLGGDIDTMLKTNCSIFGRKITTTNGYTMIPLAMAPLHANNLVFPSAKWHELCINIEFAKPMHDDLQLYGNKYFFDSEDRQKIFNNAHEFVVMQTQYCGADKIKKGHNTIKINFNHPLHLIYFWGFDKSKVVNVRLTLENAPYYDGPLDPLEHVKNIRGYDVDPCMIFFTQDPIDVQPKSSVNFSRIDRATLEIDTTDDTECDIHVVGISYQGLRYMDGMVGLVYSK